MPLKMFIIWSSGSTFVKQSGTICVILVERIWQPSCAVERNHICNFERGIIGNIHVNLFDILTSGSGDVV